MWALQQVYAGLILIRNLLHDSFWLAAQVYSVTGNANIKFKILLIS